MATIAKMQDVGLIYHERNGETLAVEHLDLEIQKGEFISIVGPSGCGKTSVLSMLAGLIKPSYGTVSYNDGKAPGYMLQRDHLLDWRTIEWNVLLGLQVKGMLNAESRSYAMELLKKYGLWDFRDAYPRQLSGGMRQKVALIRTLAFSPALLLLDEPFSALDFQMRLRLADEVYDIIRREEKTALLVTHDISEAISMGDRLLVFSQRPAHITAEHSLHFSAKTPLARRNEPGFQDYFNMVWKELDQNEA